jgi:Na+-transporting NADH:ubiquinone oxidoreductase subunit A
MHFTIKRGLDIPLPGAPAQILRNGPRIETVALQGSDFAGLRPQFRVEEGEEISAGQVLFVDRRRPEIQFVAPVSGSVIAVNRGHRRMLDSIVLRVAGERSRTFDPPGRPDASNVRALLLESGQWPALRCRPFERIADPDSVPAALFVTAMTTEPLGVDAAAVLREEKGAFAAGIAAIRHLTPGPLFVCRGADRNHPAVETDEQVQVVEFRGPHPAGLPGTHIHFLLPAGRQRKVWHIGFQDVIAIGHLMQTGRISAERIVSVGGPAVQSPALVRTCLGADLMDLTAGILSDGGGDVLSGSALSGRSSRYLGRYHTQVTALPHGHVRAGQGLVARALMLLARFQTRSIIPISAYDDVMPLDILPVPLMRALSVGDVETAEQLGCLELAEDDMRLLSHVCPARIDYAALLRRALEQIEAQS